MVVVVFEHDTGSTSVSVIGAWLGALNSGVDEPVALSPHVNSFVRCELSRASCCAVVWTPPGVVAAGVAARRAAADRTVESAPARALGGWAQRLGHDCFG